MGSKKYLLGFDIGSSSVKASLLDVETGGCVVAANAPDQEMGMIAHKAGWAEQAPEMWWQALVAATQKLHQKYTFEGNQVAAIGISYQMHGLVVVDKHQNVLRPAIIWCDSRAVEIGKNAFDALGKAYCLEHLLNSPGNFTASKLRWVQEEEPHIYKKIHKIMLPGDYIAMRMTDVITTTVSGLSEGIFWDFQNKEISKTLMDYYGFDTAFIPTIKDTFSPQGALTTKAAKDLGLSAGIPIAYRAGDQPNNAFSLGVLNTGEIATTAGTSGVIYGITDKVEADKKSRINTFVHVNNTKKESKNGVLMCVNGTGSLNSWLHRTIGNKTYETMNELAAKTPIGANGLKMLPFGNGAERILENRAIGAQLIGLNFNIHNEAHLYRAAQESIVFALQYGLEIMQKTGVKAEKIRAGRANMFLSPLFREIFANTTGATVELFDTDGAQGAARGAGIGVGIYDMNTAFHGLKKLEEIVPQAHFQAAYKMQYEEWKLLLK